MTVSSPATGQKNQAGCRSSNNAGKSFNMTILGNGFFVVRDPQTDFCYATQTGDFRIDTAGYFVTPTGARLQGRTDGMLSALGDLQINAASLLRASVPGSAMICYAIDEWGKITVQLSDGTYFLCGQVMLQNFQDPEALVSEGNELYSNLSAAGPLQSLTPPGSQGLGAIESNVLELSVFEPITQAA
jgi:flagellar hook protein FlgE